ncbi:capsule assembly Wzi family protein [Catalinimonas sp. 4WD22]|uniref:capsule assembly Wzi family protein n=1 Tax=Catalinimonas locisalis TaxID=3133978 RepID=UPI0031017B10
MKLTLFKGFLLLSFYFQITASYAQQAQNRDTVTYSLGVFQTLTQKDYLPHYIASNRFGVFDLQDNLSTLLRANAFSKFHFFQKGTLSIGIDMFSKTSFQKPVSSSVFLQQAYTGFQYDFLKLTIGKKERTVGTHAEDLSSGSLAISQNAPPLPLILLEVPEYTNVPFTKGFVQFKGTFAHGWFDDERFIDTPFLHEKTFYLRFGGKNKFNIYTGLVHFVVWGGEHPAEGKIPASFKDYLRVIAAKSAEGVPTSNNTIVGEQLNALGDNLGIYDIGTSLSLPSLDLEVYYQVPYEDWSGIRIWKNKDRLLGLTIKNKTKSIYISKLNYEYINTLYQSGPGLTDARSNDFDNFGYSYGGRDNYYNNYLYRTGWTYKGHIIGTPLFFTNERAQTYIDNFSDPDKGKFDFNIVNNRIVAHHIGLKGRVIPQLEYKLLMTTTLNYGTYGGLNGGIQEWGSRTNPNLTYEFAPPLRQHYMLLEALFKLNNNLNASIIYAMDTGELSKNIGIMLGIKWSGDTLINLDKP